MRRSSAIHCTALTALTILAAGSGRAQSQASNQSANTGVIAGIVYDSLAHRSLPGATVDLAPATPGSGTPAAATADSAGHYEFTNVAPGAYIIGFFHPRLDSLGIEAPVTQVDVASGARARKDLSTPSAARIRDALCHSAQKNDSTGMLVGHVEDAATGNRISGATVTAQWAMLSFVNGHLTRTIPTVRATTSPAGWFAFCSLPSVAPISVQAAFDRDSSGIVAVDVAMSGVAMRTLYVGQATTVTVASTDTANVPDSLRAPAQHYYRGPGQLTGVVRNAVDRSPLPDVRLTVQGTGLTVSTNARGEFSMRDLPLGSQMLLARKVGYAPGEMAVNVLAAEPAHAEMSLPTMESVLDTVKIVGKRVYDADGTGFRGRQKMGSGAYFDAAQIAHIAPFETTDLLARVPSVRILHTGLDRIVLMHGIQGDCEPEYYVDGTHMKDMRPMELDRMVWPEGVAGMEVYASAAQAPPQFQMGKNGCGVVAIWTQPIQRLTPPPM